ncbi:MAG: hypothetical protein ABJL98_02855, partial [Lentilitoribacter sp.]
RPKPPQTSQDLSCTAANAQSLTRKALVLHLKRHFLRQQHVVFPQNRLVVDFRRYCTSKKLNRSPELPLSSNCPIDFASAAKNHNPSTLSNGHVCFGADSSHPV